MGQGLIVAVSVLTFALGFYAGAAAVYYFHMVNRTSPRVASLRKVIGGKHGTF